MNTNSTNVETKVKHLKQRLGLSYGIAAGLAFSAAMWGVDGYQLARSFGYLPWTKFVAGGLLAIVVCGIAGWLTSRIEKPLVGIFLWGGAAFALAWLGIIVPTVIAPAIMKILVPDLQPFLHYAIYHDASQMAGISFVWILIAAFIVAVIQIPLVEEAAFSASLFGKIIPHLVCAVLMYMAGTGGDNICNQPLRDPLVSMNETIQFSLATRGQQVDAKAARDAHVASLRPVETLVTASRRLVVSRYDSSLGNVYILINFDGNWVECGTFYSYPVNCKSLSP